MKVAFFDELKFIFIDRLLAGLELILQQVSLTDFEERSDVVGLGVFEQVFFVEVALFKFGVVLFSVVGELLVLHELVKRESQGAFAGAGIVPVLEEGFPATRNQGHLLG